MLPALFVAVLAALTPPVDDAQLTQRVVQAIQGESVVRRVAREDLGVVGSGRSDLIVAQQVTKAVQASLGRRAEGLVVRCEQGLVRLAGRVAEAADLYRASDVTRGVSGVRAVRNELVTVRGECLVPAEDSAAEAPRDLSQSFAFVTDELVGGAGLSVAVRRGVVHVSGEVNAPEARAALLARVGALADVRAVQDDLRVHAPDRAADLRLAAIVSHRLATSTLSAPWVGGLTFGVHGGLLHLGGRVPDLETRQFVELLALSLPDVLVLASEISIDPKTPASHPDRRVRPPTSMP